MNDAYEAAVIEREKTPEEIFQELKAFVEQKNGRIEVAKFENGGMISPGLELIAYKYAEIFWKQRIQELARSGCSDEGAALAKSLMSDSWTVSFDLWDRLDFRGKDGKLQTLNKANVDAQVWCFDAEDGRPPVVMIELINVRAFKGVVANQVAEDLLDLSVQLADFFQSDFVWFDFGEDVYGCGDEMGDQLEETGFSKVERGVSFFMGESFNASIYLKSLRSKDLLSEGQEDEVVSGQMKLLSSKIQDVVD